LTVYIKNVVGTKTKDIKDHTIEDYNAENTIEITMETRIGIKPERNIISIIRKDTSLRNILPKTIRLFMNNTIDNLYIRLRKRLR
jgi:hypothetical protein